MCSLYHLRMAVLDPITIDSNTPISTMFIDESGAKHSGAGIFVVGMVKVRNVGMFMRGIRDLRDKHGFYRELKFSEINDGSVRMYADIAEYLAESPVRIGASIYDANTGFTPDEPTWKVQARMTARLVVGNTNRGEAVNVLLDLVQSPRGTSAAAYVREIARARLNSTCILEAYDLDSQTTDGLQMADFIASAVSYGRRFPDAEKGRAKARVVARFRRAFGLDDFSDVREGKVNILTMNDAHTYQELNLS